eukprot:14400856-Alexandrium_andersonii.AAC.1
MRALPAPLPAGPRTRPPPAGRPPPSPSGAPWASGTPPPGPRRHGAPRRCPAAPGSASAIQLLLQRGGPGARRLGRPH